MARKKAYDPAVEDFSGMTVVCLRRLTEEAGLKVRSRNRVPLIKALQYAVRKGLIEKVNQPAFISAGCPVYYRPTKSGRDNNIFNRQSPAYEIKQTIKIPRDAGRSKFSQSIRFASTEEVSAEREQFRTVQSRIKDLEEGTSEIEALLREQGKGERAINNLISHITDDSSEISELSENIGKDVSNVIKRLERINIYLNSLLGTTGGNKQTIAKILKEKREIDKKISELTEAKKHVEVKRNNFLKRLMELLKSKSQDDTNKDEDSVVERIRELLELSETKATFEKQNKEKESALLETSKRVENLNSEVSQLKQINQDLVKSLDTLSEQLIDPATLGEKTPDVRISAYIESLSSKVAEIKNDNAILRTSVINLQAKEKENKRLCKQLEESERMVTKYSGILKVFFEKDELEEIDEQKLKSELSKLKNIENSVKKIERGKFEIDSITDENLKEGIIEYKNWELREAETKYEARLDELEKKVTQKNIKIKETKEEAQKNLLKFEQEKENIIDEKKKEIERKEKEIEGKFNTQLILKNEEIKKLERRQDENKTLAESEREKALDKLRKNLRETNQKALMEAKESYEKKIGIAEEKIKQNESKLEERKRKSEEFLALQEENKRLKEVETNLARRIRSNSVQKKELAKKLKIVDSEHKQTLQKAEEDTNRQLVELESRLEEAKKQEIANIRSSLDAEKSKAVRAKSEEKKRMHDETIEAKEAELRRVTEEFKKAAKKVKEENLKSLELVRRDLYTLKQKELSYIGQLDQAANELKAKSSEKHKVINEKNIELRRKEEELGVLKSDKEKFERLASERAQNISRLNEQMRNIISNNESNILDMNLKYDLKLEEYKQVYTREIQEGRSKMQTEMQQMLNIHGSEKSVLENTINELTEIVSRNQNAQSDLEQARSDLNEMQSRHGHEIHALRNENLTQLTELKSKAEAQLNLINGNHQREVQLANTESQTKIQELEEKLFRQREGYVRELSGLSEKLQNTEQLTQSAHESLRQLATEKNELEKRARVELQQGNGALTKLQADLASKEQEIANLTKSINEASQYFRIQEKEHGEKLTGAQKVNITLQKQNEEIVERLNFQTRERDEFNENVYNILKKREDQLGIGIEGKGDSAETNGVGTPEFLIPRMEKLLKLIGEEKVENFIASPASFDESPESDTSSETPWSTKRLYSDHLESGELEYVEKDNFLKRFIDSVEQNAYYNGIKYFFKSSEILDDIGEKISSGTKAQNFILEYVKILSETQSEWEYNKDKLIYFYNHRGEYTEINSYIYENLTGMEAFFGGIELYVKNKDEEGYILKFEVGRKISVNLFKFLLEYQGSITNVLDRYQEPEFDLSKLNFMITNDNDFFVCIKSIPKFLEKTTNEMMKKLKEYKENPLLSQGSVEIVKAEENSYIRVNVFEDSERVKFLEKNTKRKKEFKNEVNETNCQKLTETMLSENYYILIDNSQFDDYLNSFFVEPFGMQYSIQRIDKKSDHKIMEVTVSVENNYQYNHIKQISRFYEAELKNIVLKDEGDAKRKSEDMDIDVKKGILEKYSPPPPKPGLNLFFTEFQRNKNKMYLVKLYRFLNILIKGQEKLSVEENNFFEKAEFIPVIDVKTIVKSKEISVRDDIKNSIVKVFADFSNKFMTSDVSSIVKKTFKSPYIGTELKNYYGFASGNEESLWFTEDSFKKLISYSNIGNDKLHARVSRLDENIVIYIKRIPKTKDENTIFSAISKDVVGIMSNQKKDIIYGEDTSFYYDIVKFPSRLNQQDYYKNRKTLLSYFTEIVLNKIIFYADLSVKRLFNPEDIWGSKFEDLQVIKKDDEYYFEIVNPEKDYASLLEKLGFVDLYISHDNLMEMITKNEFPVVLKLKKHNKGFDYFDEAFEFRINDEEIELPKKPDTNTSSPFQTQADISLQPRKQAGKGKTTNTSSAFQTQADISLQLRQQTGKGKTTNTTLPRAGKKRKLETEATVLPLTYKPDVSQSANDAKMEDVD